jgi:hypothetical protein
MKLWALDECYKVNPVKGSILEIDGKYYNRSSKHGYDRKNPIWDADNRLIKVCGARNETVGFQVMIGLNGVPRNPLTFSLSDFRGPKKLKAGSNVAIYREWYIKVEKAWYPDGLIPLSNNSSVRLTKPNNKIPGQKIQGFFIDIFIPPSTKAGTYHAVLKVAKGKKVLFTGHLQLEVLSVTLPSRPSFTLELNNYGGVETTHNVPFIPIRKRLRKARTREFDKQLLNYHRLARQHYACFNPLFYTQRGWYDASTTPVLDSSRRIKSFGPWDKKFSPFLSGRAFKQGYGAGEPVSVFYLPFSLEWPAPYNWFPSDLFTQSIADATRTFDKHVKSRGWTKTDYHLMLNHKERRSPFPFNCDEPTRIRDYGLLQYYGRAFKKGQFKKASAMVFRLDIGHYECTCIMDKCDWLPGEIRCSHKDQLKGIADLYVISYGSASKKSFDKRKRQGAKVWLYLGASWINRPLNEMRQLLLFTYSQGAQGYCAWNVNGWGAGNPWIKVGKRYGHDYLYYPGKDVGINAPLPSLRLKMARRAIIDMEYLDILKKKRPTAVQKYLPEALRGFNGTRISLMDVQTVRKVDVTGKRKYFWEDLRARLIKGIKG